MRRNVLIASVALLALVSVGCGDVHLHGAPRHHHYRHRRVYRHEPAPRVVHVHTRPAPPPVVVHAPPPPPRPPVVVVTPDRHPGRPHNTHPGRGHAYGHYKNRGNDGEVRIKAKGEKGMVDLRVKVDD